MRYGFPLSREWQTFVLIKASLDFIMAAFGVSFSIVLQARPGKHLTVITLAGQRPSWRY